jgi:hypothetical protein
MATKLSLTKQQLREREEEGNPAGTYFAITAMLVLLALVAIYFWIDNGHQVLESPIVQQGAHLTPHDAY